MSSMVVTMKSGRVEIVKVSPTAVDAAGQLGEQLNKQLSKTTFFFWAGRHIFMLDAVETIVFVDDAA